MNVNLVLIITVWVFVMLLAVIAFIIIRQWNIPVVILRYQGDKRRPLFVPTKARKKTKNGVTRLYVRGYRHPLRDFKSENYFPFVKGKKGALILWEPKPGTLTPTVPFSKKLARKAKTELEKAYKEYASLAQAEGIEPVDFLFEEDEYTQLLLDAVDDTDIDFMLQEYARVDSQYTTGWQEFLAKYGSHIVLVIVAAFLLTGFIVWLDKSPEFIATCAATAQEASANVLSRYAENFGGQPPG